MPSGHTPGDHILHVPLGIGERLEPADAPNEMRILAHAVELVTLGQQHRRVVPSERHPGDVLLVRFANVAPHRGGGLVEPAESNRDWCRRRRILQEDNREPQFVAALERDDDIGARIRAELLPARGHEGLDGGIEIRFALMLLSPGRIE